MALGWWLVQRWRVHEPESVRPRRTSPHNSTSQSGCSVSSCRSSCKYVGGAGWITARALEFKIVLKELKDAFILVGPTGGSREGMVFHRVGSDRPILFTQVDQPLHQPHRVLVVH